MTMFRTPLAITQVTTQEPDWDVSNFLETMDLSEETREVIRRGWTWYMAELPGGIRTVSAQMLDERSDADLLAIPGMSRRRLQEVRAAVAADSGVITNAYPHITREELAAYRAGAFTEEVDNTVFGPDGVPVPHRPPCARCGDAEWTCEEHPELAWPHDDCPGPGQPCPECHLPSLPASVEIEDEHGPSMEVTPPISDPNDEHGEPQQVETGSEVATIPPPDAEAAGSSQPSPAATPPVKASTKAKPSKEAQ